MGEHVNLLTAFWCVRSLFLRTLEGQLLLLHTKGKGTFSFGASGFMPFARLFGKKGDGVMRLA
jgi:hypothetical protein